MDLKSSNEKNGTHNVSNTGAASTPIKPANAAEEIEYLNKVLDDIENKSTQSSLNQNINVKYKKIVSDNIDITQPINYQSTSINSDFPVQINSIQSSVINNKGVSDILIDSSQSSTNNPLNNTEISFLDTPLYNPETENSAESLSGFSLESSLILGNISDLLGDSSSLNLPIPSCLSTVNLSLVKSEPLEDLTDKFDLGDFLDPGENFRIKEELVSQSENTIQMDISGAASVKTEQDCIAIMPSSSAYEVRFRVDEKINLYSREQLHAAKLISQSTLAAVVDMGMFESVAKSMPVIKLPPLEYYAQNIARVSAEDYNIVYKFCLNHGKSPSKWKKSFKYKSSSHKKGHVSSHHHYHHKKHRKDSTREKLKKDKSEVQYISTSPLPSNSNSNDNFPVDEDLSVGDLIFIPQKKLKFTSMKQTNENRCNKATNSKKSKAIIKDLSEADSDSDLPKTAKKVSEKSKKISIKDSIASSTSTMKSFEQNKYVKKVNETIDSVIATTSGSFLQKSKDKLDSVEEVSKEKESSFKGFKEQLPDKYKLLQKHNIETRLTTVVTELIPFHEEMTIGKALEYESKKSEVSVPNTVSELSIIDNQSLPVSTKHLSQNEDSNHSDEINVLSLENSTTKIVSDDTISCLSLKVCKNDISSKISGSNVEIVEFQSGENAKIDELNVTFESILPKITVNSAICDTTDSRKTNRETDMSKKVIDRDNIETSGNLNVKVNPDIKESDESVSKVTDCKNQESNSKQIIELNLNGEKDESSTEIIGNYTKSESKYSKNNENCLKNSLLLSKHLGNELKSESVESLTISNSSLKIKENKHLVQTLLRKYKIKRCYVRLKDISRRRKYRKTVHKQLKYISHKTAISVDENQITSSKNDSIPVRNDKELRNNDKELRNDSKPFKNDNDSKISKNNEPKTDLKPIKNNNLSKNDSKHDKNCSEPIKNEKLQIPLKMKDIPSNARQQIDNVKLDKDRRLEIREKDSSAKSSREQKRNDSLNKIRAERHKHEKNITSTVRKDKVPQNPSKQAVVEAVLQPTPKFSGFK